MGEAETNPAPQSSQDGLYQEAAETYGAALDRLARAYEADAEIRRDLLQEIHIALWRSFAGSYAAVVAIFFFLIARLNQRGADRLQRQIDELNAAEKLLP